MKAVLELEELEVDCILGDLPEERLAPRRVYVDAQLEFDAEESSFSDELADAIDYVTMANRIRAALVNAQCRLLECAAKTALDAALNDPRVSSATIAVRKKATIPGLGSARVVMTGKR